LFRSLQGEGPSAGTPAHFLRLQGCDVGCVWCDTKYSWDPERGRTVSIADAFRELFALGDAPLLVVTGGEPLAHPGVERLLVAALGRWPRIEVETSGSEPPPLSHERLHYVWSPKLPRVTPRWADTWLHAARFLADPRTTVKLVVGAGEGGVLQKGGVQKGGADEKNAETDADAALRLIREHGIPRERVALMPEGVTDQDVRAHALGLAELCQREGLRLSPRLHVWLWGAKRGV